MTDYTDTAKGKKKMKKRKTQTNYEKGRTFEYKIATWFRRRGYFVLRSAGSHSPVDLIATKSGRRLLFIQCKKGAGGISVEEQNRLFLTAVEVGAIPIVASAEDRKPTIFKRITGISIKKGDAERIVKGHEMG